MTRVGDKYKRLVAIFPCDQLLAESPWATSVQYLTELSVMADRFEDLSCMVATFFTIVVQRDN
jgi:hypothetical protein